MAEEHPSAHDGDADAGAHGIHMPPPSVVPINVACALTTTFVGFIDQVRNAVGPLVWGIGLLWLIASCTVWFIAARREFNDLPESADSH